MPWINQTTTEQKLSLVLAILSRREPVAVLCRRFKVSRQSAYKYLRRFKQHGRNGLLECSRRPGGSATESPWLRRLLSLRKRRPTWGARKLRWWMKQRWPRRRLPSERTLQRWLQRAGLTRQHTRKRTGPGPHCGAPCCARRSNDVWTVDFKGWYRSVDGHKIEPLTVRDLHSRYLLAVTAVPNAGEAPVRRVFKRLFQHYGYPRAIRADRGVPFCSVGPLNLTRLSLWWHRLGIKVEFVDRSRRIDNNAHEQMHRVLQAEVVKIPGDGFLSQLRQLNTWRHYYNHQRPHQSLGDRTPASCYHPKKSAPPPLILPSYPPNYTVRRVGNRGLIRLGRETYFISKVFCGLPLGLLPSGTSTYTIFFDGLRLGALHLDTHRFIPASPATNPPDEREGADAPSL